MRLSLFLNTETDRPSLMCMGKAFQSLGDGTEKAISP